LGEEAVHTFRDIEELSPGGEIVTAFKALRLPGKTRNETTIKKDSPSSRFNVTAARVGDIAFVGLSGEVLTEIGMAMLVYANDYEDELPRAGGINTQWGPFVRWDAVDQFIAYNLSADSRGGQASISSSFYLMVKYSEVAPKLFICPGDSGAKKFKLSDYPNRNPAIEELADAWDFGNSHFVFTLCNAVCKLHHRLFPFSHDKIVYFWMLQQAIRHVCRMPSSNHNLAGRKRLFNYFSCFNASLICYGAACYSNYFWL